MKPRLILLGLVASLAGPPLLARSPAPDDVWIVDDDGLADFADIQSAVDAAASGDAILVKPGAYAGFEVTGKAISIVGDAVAPVAVDGLVRLRNLPADEGLSVSNLQLLRGLRLHDCAGEVRLADCSLQPTGLCASEAAEGSHRIIHCESVVLTRTDVHGRTGDSIIFCGSVEDGLVGETALSVRDSRVALYSCLVQGGEGGDADDGSCVFCIDGIPGDGGIGLRALEGSTVYSDDSVLLGGQGAPDPGGCDFEQYVADDGEPVELIGGSTLELAADPVLALESSTLVRADEQLAVVVRGPVGAVAWLIWSDDADWRPFGGTLGILHCQSLGATLQPLGTISGTGLLDASFTPPPLLAGQEVRRISIQVFAIASGTGRILGTPSNLHVVDPAF